MSADLLWRLVWKEYRMQRGFWIAMALGSVALQLFVCVWAALSTREVLDSEVLFGIPFAMVILYALGCGATLFATEHEAGTFQFQRSLPLPAASVVSSKFLFAGASTLLLAIVLWCWTLLPARGQLPENHLAGWLFGWLLAAEMLAWSIFCSLLTKTPLRAAFFGAILAFVVSWAGIPGLMVWLQRGSGLSFDDAWSSFPVRVGALLVLVVLDGYLAWRWFQERSLWTFLWPRSTVAWRVWRPKRGSALTRLLWQQTRQSVGMLAVLAILLLILQWLSRLTPTPWSEAELYPWIVVIVSLIGSSTFLADQSSRRYRFLAEHAASPRLVWLARQLFGAALAICWAALFVGLTRSTADDLQFLDEKAETFLLASVGLAAIAYTSGQLTSLLVRSGVLAAFVGLALTGLLSGWALSMRALGVPLWWSVAPIPLVLLWASWLRAPDWLVERTSWPARARAAASLLVPAAILLVAVPTYRAYEIPAVAPGFDVRQYIREQRAGDPETTRLLLAAAETLQFTSPEVNSIWYRPEEAGADPSTVSIREPAALSAAEVQWLQENQQALELALQASRRQRPELLPGTLPPFERWQRLLALVSLVMTKGRHLQEQGDLDAAMEHYLAALRLSGYLRGPMVGYIYADQLERRIHEALVSWAAQAGQTAARIENALQRFDETIEAFPPYTDAVKHSYVTLWQDLHGDSRWLQQQYNMTEGEAQLLLTIRRLAPWELARARRLLNQASAEAIANIEEVRQLLLQNPAAAARAQVSVSTQREYKAWDGLWAERMGHGAWLAEGMVDMEQRREALRLRLEQRATELAN